MPKIGHSLGISETLYAKGYPVEGNQQKNNSFKKIRTGPKYSNEINKDNFVIVDFPGFEDTRGTNFEIITSFSIDRTLEAL